MRFIGKSDQLISGIIFIALLVHIFWATPKLKYPYPAYKIGVCENNEIG
jgi:hypothetical protein